MPLLLSPRELIRDFLGIVMVTSIILLEFFFGRPISDFLLDGHRLDLQSGETYALSTPRASQTSSKAPRPGIRNSHVICSLCLSSGATTYRYPSKDKKSYSLICRACCMHSGFGSWTSLEGRNGEEEEKAFRECSVCHIEQSDLWICEVMRADSGSNGKNTKHDFILKCSSCFGQAIFKTMLSQQATNSDSSVRTKVGIHNACCTGQCVQ
ncbi:hypothetical protein BX666DRAFT_1991948 [Dichotomocladium elegans]|nr:hypothetical protein BX666DRAFT_1991948 [Dichotomocladium elegans]